MADDDQPMTDVEAYDDEEIRQFVQDRKFANPHSVVVNARDITFTGSGEKLDGDMIAISVNILEENMNGLSTMSTYAMFEVLYYRQRNDGGALQGYTRGGSKQTSKPVNCERFVVLRDLHGRAGANVMTVLMGRNKNSRLYDQHISGRDAGSFSPGAILVLESPRPVQTWLGHNMPTMDIPGSWKVVVAGTIDLPETPIQTGSPRQHAFHYPKVNLKIVNFYPLETNCMGDMCNALEMYSDGSIATSCPCQTAVKRKGNLVALVDMIVTLEDGTVFHVNDFTSKSFTNMFLKNGVPTGINGQMVANNKDRMRGWRNRMCNAIKFINGRGGFAITGWVRRGMVEDESTKVGPAQATSAPKTFIKSSDLKLHITHITVNKDSCGNKIDFDKYLFDMNSVSVANCGRS